MPEFTKLEEISGSFLAGYLCHYSLHSLAALAISSFSKALAQLSVNAEKRLGENCEGWDEELLSKINTFLASKFERMIGSIKLTTITLNDYYDAVLFLNKLIDVLSKRMDVNGTILRASLDAIHKRSSSLHVF